MTLNQDDNQKELEITMTGIQVMNDLSIDAINIFYIAKKGILLPDYPKKSIWFKFQPNPRFESLEGILSQWIYLKSDVEAFKLNNKKYLEEMRQQKANSELLIEADSKSAAKQKEKIPLNENRDKNNDIKQCREIANKYVTDCKAKKEIPSIAKAIETILLLDFGRTYTEKQVRNWITRKPPIFPKDSSKKGRRKNS